MKSQAFIFIFVTLTLFFPRAAFSQQTYRVHAHEITIEGTSNLQSWTAGVEQASGQFVVLVEGGKITEVREANLRIVSGSIKGSEGRSMDSKIYKALDTDRHPNILFNLRDIISLAENPGTFRIAASGSLSIAGVSRLVNLRTVGKVLPNGDLEFTGSQAIKMTDHQVTPPTALLGTLRTGDEVTVHFKVILRAS